jgi:hypothetical protein
VLEYQGLFRNTLEFDIYQEFVPWMYREVLEELDEGERNRRFVEEVVREAEGEMTEEFY